jgi:hypothetical protein
LRLLGHLTSFAFVQLAFKRIRVKRLSGGPPVSSLPSALQAASRHRSARQDVTVPIPSAFAFYAPDNTMDPYIKVGTLMYASKRRDPLAGDFILVSDRNGRSRVRLLIDIHEKGLHMSKPSLRQDLMRSCRSTISRT